MVLYITGTFIFTTLFILLSLTSALGDAQLLVFVIVIPLPLFFAQTIYGTKGLTAWVAIGIAWAFFSAFTVIICPLYESRVALGMVFKGLIKVSLPAISYFYEYLLNDVRGRIFSYAVPDVLWFPSKCLS